MMEDDNFSSSKSLLDDKSGDSISQDDSTKEDKDEDSDQTTNSWENVDETNIDDIDKNGAEDDQWEDILGSGALLKKVIHEGEKDTKPKRQMICTINYTCNIESGDEVENAENLKVQQGDLDVRCYCILQAKLIVFLCFQILYKVCKYTNFDKCFNNKCKSATV